MGRIVRIGFIIFIFVVVVLFIFKNYESLTQQVSFDYRIWKLSPIKKVDPQRVGEQNLPTLWSINVGTLTVLSFLLGATVVILYDIIEWSNYRIKLRKCNKRIKELENELESKDNLPLIADRKLTVNQEEKTAIKNGGSLKDGTSIKETVDSIFSDSN